MGRCVFSHRCQNVAKCFLIYLSSLLGSGASPIVGGLFVKSVLFFVHSYIFPAAKYHLHGCFPSSLVQKQTSETVNGTLYVRNGTSSNLRGLVTLLDIFEVS